MKRLIVIGLLSLLLVPCSLCAQERQATTRADECITIFNDVMRQVDVNYVDTLNYESLTEEAINAMLHKIDPYTIYYPKKNDRELRMLTTGKYGGIGSIIQQRPRPDKAGKKQPKDSLWTYAVNPYEGKPAETLYVPNGGETNVEEDPDEPETIGLPEKVYAKAEEEMAKYHWSFCGSTYSEEITDRWRNNGIYEVLDRKLGYRYQLVTASLPDDANAGGKATVTLQIRNTGFAPLYNERHAYIVLKNGSNTYPIQLQSDPRRWLPNGAVTTIEEELTIPANVPAGTYQLYMHLPDAAESLAADPRYAIRFANVDIWDATTGMNKLNASVTIHEAGQAIDTVSADKNGIGYDLLGRPVNSSYHGVVIRNGEKHIQ